VGSRAEDEGAEGGTEDQQKTTLPPGKTTLAPDRTTLPPGRGTLPPPGPGGGTTNTTDQQETPVYRGTNQIVPAGADLPPVGPQVVPPGPEEVPPGLEEVPSGPQVPPDEVLKALHIVNVQGRGYMKATHGPNGTIVMVPVDPVASARKWSHK